MRGTSKPKAIELSLPYAPEMIDLVPADENFHGGVSIADATAEAAFEMIMLAYLNQEKSDGVRLYLNDELVDNTTIEEGKEAENTSLYIPPGRFHSGLNIARFGIKRISQDEVPTPDLKLLYRSVPPGGTPPVLSLRASHTSVGPDEADKFVLTVSYDKANWYDRIHVDCAGEPVRHQSVPQTTSPLPPVPASIDIPIPRSVFEQAGDSAAFPITFRVTDYLTNSSPSSLPLTIDVHLQRQQLPAAVFREVLADISDDPTEVNLGKMKGGPLWALLYLPNTTWQPEDSIHLKFTSVIAAEVAEHDVTLLKQDLPTYFNWEIPNVKVLRDSKVEMIYEQIRDGKIVGRSMAAIAQVIGNPTIELPPPTLSPPTVPINVLANPNGVKLQVTDFTAEKDDKAQFVQVNAPAGAPPFPVVDFIDGLAEILLSAAFLAAWHGKAVEFQWNLIRAGTPAEESPTSKFEIMKIADEDKRLPLPNIAEVLDDVLDVNNLADDARIHIARWQPIAIGQKIWLRLTGTDENGEPYGWIIYDGANVESSDLNGLFPLASADKLRALQNDSELQVEFKINYSGDTNEDQAVTAPIRSYIIMSTPRLCIETTTLYLDGKNAIVINPPASWARFSDPIGSMDRRHACGGTPPYNYRSNDVSVASVNDRGVVRSIGNGKATIMVTDAKNNSVNFEVQTANVWTLIISTETFADPAASDAWIRSQNGIKLDPDTLLHHEILQLATSCYGGMQMGPAYFVGNNNSNNYMVCTLAQLYGKVPKLTFYAGSNTPKPWPAMYLKE